jgi:hypothetical protein
MITIVFILYDPQLTNTNTIDAEQGLAFLATIQTVVADDKQVRFLACHCHSFPTTID